MKASAFEFRFRFWIIVVIYVLGFMAPWDMALHLDGSGPHYHVWARLAVLLSRNGAMSITAAFNLVLVVAIVLAGVGAWMRTWASAYLGVDVMSDTNLRGDAVVADGPYRYLRNPLYVGWWIHALALSILMPPSGAIFSLVFIVLFQVRLIFGEEAFLHAKLGDPYVAYCANVPRLLPAVHARVSASGARPHWLRAASAEIFMWGVTVSYAALGWQYDAELLLRCMLVSLGVSLIVRAVQGRG